MTDMKPLEELESEAIGGQSGQLPAAIDSGAAGLQGRDGRWFVSRDGPNGKGRATALKNSLDFFLVNRAMILPRDLLSKVVVGDHTGRLGPRSFRFSSL
jgi:hypothetical protein